LAQAAAIPQITLKHSKKAELQHTYRRGRLKPAKQQHGVWEEKGEREKNLANKKGAEAPSFILIGGPQGAL
jgi:hypothetical protein